MDYSDLRFYHPDRFTRVHRGDLPHWDQPGVCAFVTFMLRDAMPKSVAADWQKARECWCIHRGIPTNSSSSDVLERLGPIHFQRFQRFVSNAYGKSLDRGAGECLLAQKDCAAIVLEAIEYQHTRRGHIFDFVIMPNHVHLLFQTFPDVRLKTVLSSIRSYSARCLNQHLQRKGAVWDKEPFDHLVRSEHYFRRYQQYIRANPQRAGLKEGQVVLRTWDGS